MREGAADRSCGAFADDPAVDELDDALAAERFLFAVVAPFGESRTAEFSPVFLKFAPSGGRSFSCTPDQPVATERA